MICDNCGATATAEATTCTRCGAPLVPAPEPPASGYTPGQTPGPAAGTAAGPGPRPGPGALPGSGTDPAAGGWGQYHPHPSGLSSEVRGWGIGAHLVGLGGALVTVVTLGFLGPLLIWLIKRDEHPFIDHHAKESLNFQLTSLLAMIVAGVAAIPVVLLGFLTLGILWIAAALAVLAAVAAWFVFPIIGAVKAANGEGYRYPVCIRFVR